MSWPALGRDPAPGDVDAVRRLASSFGTVADRAEELLGVLRRIDDGAGTAVWRGPAADDFRRLLGDVGPGLVKLAGSYEDAERAATAYATALGDAQDLGRRAEADAQRAGTDRVAADGRRRAAAADADTHAAARRAARMRIVEAQALQVTTAVIADPGYAASVASYEQKMRARYAHAAAAEAEARGRERAAEDAVHGAEQRAADARRLGEEATDEHARAKAAFVRALQDAGDASGVRPDLVHRVWREMQRSVAVGLDPQQIELWKWASPKKDPNDPHKRAWMTEKYLRDHRLDPDDAREYHGLISASTSGDAAWFDRQVEGGNGWASGSAGVQAMGLEGGARAGVGAFDDGSYGAALGVSGAAYALRGRANGRLGNDRFGLEGGVDGQVGARGEIGADIGFGKNQVRATVGADAFVGAEVGAQAALDLGGVKPTVGAHAQAGFGGTAKADIGFHNGKFKIDGEFGVAIGLGAKVDGSVEIDVPKVADTIGDAGKGAFDFAKKSIGSIPTPW